MIDTFLQLVEIKNDCVVSHFFSFWFVFVNYFTFSFHQVVAPLSAFILFLLGEMNFTKYVDHVGMFVSFFVFLFVRTLQVAFLNGLTWNFDRTFTLVVAGSLLFLVKIGSKMAAVAAILFSKK